ncbi:MAG: thioredoxin [Erythrobacter sp.]|nr:thioredoxin [Erythrobacter sp.]
MPSAPEPQPAPEPAADGPSISHWRAPNAGSEADAADKSASLAARALRRGLGQGDQPGGDERVVPLTDPPAALRDPELPDPDLTEPATGIADPPFDDEDYAEEGSQFDYRAPFTRRRNTLRMWTLAAAIFAALAMGTVAAVNYYGLPDWLPLQRPTFGVGTPGLALDFPPAEQRSETLESGEKIFRVRGSISNTTRETMAVPNLLVVFSDARKRNVGDWVVVPAKRQLAPGETVTVTEAIANIPPSAAAAALGWAPK